MGDNVNKKEIQLELNEKTLKRASDALLAMKEEFSKRTPKRPAEELVRQHIELIDELSKLGAKLPQIYERLNKVVPLGISANSFSVYVRRVRKETGSEFYSKRSTKKPTDEDNTVAVPSAQLQTESVPSSTAGETSIANVKTGWNCEKCESSAKPEEYKGETIWSCEACGVVYSSDAAGKISNVRFTG